MSTIEINKKCQVSMESKLHPGRIGFYQGLGCEKFAVLTKNPISNDFFLVDNVFFSVEDKYVSLMES